MSTISGNEAETRERRIVALAGLAGLGSAVLPEIRAAAADPDLTIRERLMLGLAAATLGDSGTARSIAGALVERYGEAVTDQARLQVGGSAADIAAATALMALLAAANGDPLAPRFWAYVEFEPGHGSAVRPPRRGIRGADARTRLPQAGDLRLRGRR